MKTLKEKILVLLKEQSGLSDREITDSILGNGLPQQSVNQACRSLEANGVIKRVNRNDGVFGNYIVTDISTIPTVEQFKRQEPANLEKEASMFSEDNLKEILKNHLSSNGWETQIAWGRKHGIDVEAIRGTERWIIEVKGMGSSNPMNVNYFLGILGETLQRMVDSNAKYSIALPDIKQFRNLWNRLPLLAKKRTGITALFINEDGVVKEIS